MYSTNYINTLICPAEDCQILAKIPEKAGSVAALQYEIITEQPYQLTSDDILSFVAAKRKGIAAQDMDRFCQEFFSKGQACFRASPLTKTHGWAVHFDEHGFTALLAPNDNKFSALKADENVKKINAMRNKRA